MATKFEIVHSSTQDPKTGAPKVKTIVRDPDTQQEVGVVSHMKVVGGPIDGFSAVIEFGPPPPPAPAGDSQSTSDQGASTTITKDAGAKGAQTGAATPLAGK